MPTETDVTQFTSPSMPLTADQLKSQISLIQRAMKAVMKDGTHYGKIPGTQKKTLYKAGSEVLLTMFHVSVEPEVADLSTSDEVRYRVRAVGRHQLTGTLIGIGVGECSSNEEKYRWRNSVCDEEFDEAQDDRRRIKWQRYGDQVSQRKQVRTVPADVANTVLKMAKKRAQVDLTLTGLAASDIFTQDIGDPEDERDRESSGTEGEEPRGRPSTDAPRSTSGNGKHCTDKQVNLLKARLDNAGVPENAFCKHYGVDFVADLPFNKVDEALKWIEKVHG